MTISLGSLFQCVKTLLVKNLSLMSSLNLQTPLSQLDTIRTGPITGHQREEIGACPSTPPYEEAVDHNEVSLQPPLFLAEWV